MSRKNLSRTVIEGGRYRGNKWDRRNSHAEERARVKNYIQEVTLDPENYEEYDVEPIEHVYKGFRDKLGPMYRWLQSQVGRPWNDVRSDVFKSFDIRTTAGRHIVFDHLLSSVTVGEEPQYRWRSEPDDPTTSYSDHDYYVDDEGILRKKRYLGRRRYRDPVPAFDTNRIANWLSGRVVGKVGDKLFWFIPVGKSKKHRGFYGAGYTWRTVWGYPKDYYYYGSHYGLHWEYLYEEAVYKRDSVGNLVYEDGKLIEVERKKTWRSGSKPYFRQDRKLNDKELEFWNSMPEYHRTKILEQSPNYPTPPKDPNRYYY